MFLGDRFQNKAGEWFEVVRYDTGKKITVKFDLSDYECVVEGQEIRRGCIVDPKTRYPQPGQQYTTQQNGTLEIVAYNGASSVTVRFLETGFVTTCELVQIRRGTVKDLLLPRVSGVGYLGVGEHSARNKLGGAEWAYQKWQNMLERCFTPTTEQMRLCYEDVTICSEWFNYQNFAEWAKKQVGYGRRDWAMEKDLLIKGNRHYAPDHCCFLPMELNNQMLKSQATRGSYPIGVNLHKANGKFIAHCTRQDSTSTHVGIYASATEAFSAYKNAKESRLRYLAEKWKSEIDPRAYQALINYTVDITD